MVEINEGLEPRKLKAIRLEAALYTILAIGTPHALEAYEPTSTTLKPPAIEQTIKPGTTTVFQEVLPEEERKATIAEIDTFANKMAARIVELSNRTTDIIRGDDRFMAVNVMPIVARSALKGQYDEYSLVVIGTHDEKRQLDMTGPKHINIFAKESVKNLGDIQNTYTFSLSKNDRTGDWTMNVAYENTEGDGDRRSFDTADEVYRSNLSRLLDRNTFSVYSQQASKVLEGVVKNAPVNILSKVK